MSIRRKIVFLALVSLAVVCILSFYRYVPSLLNRQNCKQQLRSLWAVIALYRQEHENQWPANLKSLDQELVARLLRCPGVKTRSPLDFQNDYIYIDWSKQAHSADMSFEKYPLMYDRTMDNHSGSGINVLMVDGTVEWDNNAEWLKKFAAEHPVATFYMHAN